MEVTGHSHSSYRTAGHKTNTAWPDLTWPRSLANVAVHQLVFRRFRVRISAQKHTILTVVALLSLLKQMIRHGCFLPHQFQFII